MSIKSDLWIKKKSIFPTHMFTNARSDFNENPDGWIWEGITHTKEQIQMGICGTIREIKGHEQFRMLQSGLFQPMIDPFESEQVRQAGDEKIISYGLSSYGYDVRAANEWKLFTNLNSTCVDPKNFDPKGFVDIQSDCLIIPPNSFALGRTVEYFRIPRNVLTICLGKSTYARCGIIVNVTPLEPEWEGHVTLEFSNTTPLPAKIYANEGVAQMLFLESDEDCEVSYKDRGGKYQGQTGVTIPKA